MKPMMIIPPGLMSDENIKLLRENEICVVVAKDPAKVKFVDPIPAAGQRTQMQDAAIKLSRIVLSGRWGEWTTASYLGKGDAARIYVDMLVHGTELDPNGTAQEIEESFRQQERFEEIRRLAREEARAEREKKKQKQLPKENKP